MSPVRVRSITVVGLLILTTTLTTGCDSLGIGPTAGATERPAVQPSPSGTIGQSGPTETPTLPVTGSDEPGDDGGPGDGAEPSDGLPGDGDSVDLGDPFGRPEATYSTGTATLTMGDTVITLDRIAGTGTYFAEFGGDVIWTGDSGWYLQVGGAKPNLGPTDIPAYISLDWVHDGQHWISWDEDGCQVDVIQADPAGIRGTAACANMRWVDAIAGNLADEPTPIAGQSAFAVTLQFVARP
jgi:hypothetical protein